VSSALEARREQSLGTCWYLYGVVPASSAPDERFDWPSVTATGQVDVLGEGTLAAVVTPAPAVDFDQPGLDAHLQDAAWLESKIRAHEQVLERVLAHSSVLPFRFCTIYRSEESVRGFLRERRAELEAALGQLAGRVELGVKAFADRKRLAHRLGSGVQDEGLGEGESGGRAYLERRLAEQRSADDLERVALELVEAWHEELMAHAAAGTFLRLQTPEASGRPDDMLMNAAYLVEANDRGFIDAVAALRGEYEALGIVFELTGPWPPYNFVPDEAGTG
jgi:Gas vesicle synthesis protein GvpL/GvpF